MGDLYAEWARVYDCYYPDRSSEVRFWEALAAPYGPCLLDLMCGTAEVSLELARRGYRVLGVDLSPAMLVVAAERLAAAADYPARNLSLAQGEAGALPVPDDTLDFALVGGNGSFNHLDEPQARAALGDLRRVLRPGGGLGMELVNPHLLKEVYPVRTFGPLRPPPGVWVEKESHNHYDQEAGLFHIRQVAQYEIDGQRGEYEVDFVLRVWKPDQIRAMLEEAGFGNVRTYGDYNLQPFDPVSSDLLIVADTLPG
jgi:ubiquinone/menaquinone biosynthesis C-methylase UbiE